MMWWWIEFFSLSSTDLPNLIYLPQSISLHFPCPCALHTLIMSCLKFPLFNIPVASSSPLNSTPILLSEIPRKRIQFCCFPISSLPWFFFAYQIKYKFVDSCPTHTHWFPAYLWPQPMYPKHKLFFLFLMFSLPEMTFLFFLHLAGFKNKICLLRLFEVYYRFYFLFCVSFWVESLKMLSAYFQSQMCGLKNFITDKNHL